MSINTINEMGSPLICMGIGQPRRPRERV